MGWSYKSPQAFPATYFDAIRAAITKPNEPVLFFSSLDEKDLRAQAENFRYFKWCVKQRPDAYVEMFELLSAYSFRTKITDELGFHLWITAAPNMVSEFIRLNPEIAGSILNECQ